jgi:hypothetical protein
VNLLFVVVVVVVVVVQVVRLVRLGKFCERLWISPDFFWILFVPSHRTLLHEHRRNALLTGRRRFVMCRLLREHRGRVSLGGPADLR